jgi:transcriptional regulator with XRE-family HTH domain
MTEAGRRRRTTPRPAVAREAATGTEAAAAEAVATELVATGLVATGSVAAEGELASAAPSEAVTEEQIGWVIANHVRARRQAIGQSVGQLAARTGISKGMLSKIENAQTSPSLSTLARLASALDMPVTSLFRGLAEEREAVFVRAGSGPEIIRQGTRAGHRYQLLGSLRGPERKVEPLLVSLTERTEVFPLFQHPGVELLYMLEGVMEYGYGRQRYRMEPGDTLQFEGEIAHGPTELVALPIRFLSVTLYPSP